MDCKRFREQHACYVDDTLPGVAMEHMSEHRARCAPCSAHDTRVRRALMIARSAPVVQPSAEFRRRLAARIDEERAAPRPRDRARRDPERVFSALLAAAAAAVLLFANGAGIMAARPAAAAPEFDPAAVVARPARLGNASNEPVNAQTMYATAAWNLPVYSAVLVAQRATEYYADAYARTLSVVTLPNPTH